MHIINPLTKEKIAIYSKEGRTIIKNCIKLLGGGVCSLCKSANTTSSSCPLNPKNKQSKNPNFTKHPLAKDLMNSSPKKKSLSPNKPTKMDNDISKLRKKYKLLEINSITKICCNEIIVNSNNEIAPFQWMDHQLNYIF